MPYHMITQMPPNRLTLIVHLHLDTIYYIYIILYYDIYEVFDRQSRSHNLIIFNAPKSDDNSSEKDSSLMKSLFDNLSLNMIPTTVSKLGRKSVKPSHLKVTLQESSGVFIVLKNKQKLHGSQIYSAIRIFPDYILMQRNQLRDIIVKLEEWKAAGETNLFVKFLKGIK